MRTHRPPRVMPSVAQVVPTFQENVPAERVRAAAKASGKRFYERIYTPLVVVWGFLFQRLNPDHSLDAVVSQIADGALDHLVDQHQAPLSQRVQSERTAAYSNARQRLPLAVLVEVARLLAKVAEDHQGEGARWHGHRVALLDGTTHLARPEPELVKRYGQASNGQGTSYWVVIRSVCAFCLHTAALLALAEGSQSESEQSLAKGIFAQLAPDTLGVGDGNFGVFSVAQAARHFHIVVLLRLSAPRAKALAPKALHPGADEGVVWAPSRADQTDKTMSAEPIVGRVISVRQERDGFRPVDLFLFTTLLDPTAYPLTEVVALYGRRWEVELDLRDVKSILDLDLLTAKSEAMIQKELWAGLAAYNLVRLWMAHAAPLATLTPKDLSFTRCWRRVQRLLTTRPRSQTTKAVAPHTQRFLARLAQCRRQKRQPNRVEPRAVRRRSSRYPALKGPRDLARQAVRQKRLAAPKEAKC